jgi:hypothetical protein
MLDHSLERLLLLHMKPLSNDQRDHLFFGFGPLGSFSAKIRIATAFGIIGEKTASDLEALNNIRNVFGHAAQGVTFRNKAIRDRLGHMHVEAVVSMFFRAFKNRSNRTLGSARGRYFLSAWAYVKAMDEVKKKPGPARLQLAVPALDAVM